MSDLRRKYKWDFKSLISLIDDFGVLADLDIGSPHGGETLAHNVCRHYAVCFAAKNDSFISRQNKWCEHNYFFKLRFNLAISKERAL